MQFSSLLGASLLRQACLKPDLVWGNTHLQPVQRGWHLPRQVCAVLHFRLYSSDAALMILVMTLLHEVSQPCSAAG